MRIYGGWARGISSGGPSSYEMDARRKLALLGIYPEIRVVGHRRRELNVVRARNEVSVCRVHTGLEQL